jgi:hypothetical protein
MDSSESHQTRMQSPQKVEQPSSRLQEDLPYRLRDDFLSPAERSLYGVLCAAVGEWATVCPKISLGHVFYPQSGDHSANMSYRNRIAQKHVDSLLCDPASMRPLLGVELDDASHQCPDRQNRDVFVDQVFAAAGLSQL